MEKLTPSLKVYRPGKEMMESRTRAKDCAQGIESCGLCKQLPVALLVTETSKSWIDSLLKNGSRIVSYECGWSVV